MAAEKDVVLIYFEDQPLTFARIEDISPDIKKDWYHVKLLILQVPLQVTAWILRDIYIDGAEFTMDGKKVRLEKVVCPEPSAATAETEPPKKSIGNKKVISLADLKKKDIS
jgi:hypothetical protein